MAGNQDQAYRRAREALASARNSGADAKTIGKLQASVDAAWSDVCKSYDAANQPRPAKLH